MASNSELIQKEFKKLEGNKNHLFSLIHPLSDQQYYQQPSKHAWSVAQTANHLYMSESLSLAYLKKKLSYPDSVPSYRMRSWAGVWLIKLVFATSWRRKAPKNINMWGDQPIFSKSELEAKWNALRAETILFLLAHADKFGRHLAYRHPFAGRMTMRQMLIFFNDHLMNHTRQVNRILRSIGADGSK